MIARFRLAATCVLLTVCLALSVAADASAATTRELRYSEQTGKNTLFYTWTAEYTANQVTVTQKEGKDVYTSVNTPKGLTLSWHYTHLPETDVHVVREGNVLNFSGRFQGKPVNKQEKIDVQPWFQPMSFSLQCMEQSKQDQATFWSVRPDNLETLTLKAQRKGRDAQGNLVEVRLTGLRSALWSADYWYRATDGVFVHYRSVLGPPGTSPTVISLVTAP